MKDKAASIFLFVNAVIWIPYGLLCLFRPQTLAELTGMGLSSSVAIVEVQAMYGGLEAAIGLLALWGAFDRRHAASAVLTLAVIGAGLASGRAIGLLTSGDLASYNVGALVFESTIAVFGGAIWTRMPNGG